MLSMNLAAHGETVAAFLDLMGNEKRLLIMNHLASGELSVGVLAGRVLLSPSALSQHLAKLRAFGLVDIRRDGKTIYYFCSSGAARELIVLLHRFLVTKQTLTPPGSFAERLRRLRLA